MSDANKYNNGRYGEGRSDFGSNAWTQGERDRQAAAARERESATHHNLGNESFSPRGFGQLPSSLCQERVRNFSTVSSEDSRFEFYGPYVDLNRILERPAYALVAVNTGPWLKPVRAFVNYGSSIVEDLKEEMAYLSSNYGAELGVNYAFYVRYTNMSGGTDLWADCCSGYIDVCVEGCEANPIRKTLKEGRGFRQG